MVTPVDVPTWMKEHPQMKNYRQLTAAERRRNQSSPGTRLALIGYRIPKVVFIILCIYVAIVIKEKEAMNL